MSNPNVDIEEGSVSFWTKEGAVKFNSDDSILFVQLDPQNGSITILKDSDNNLKFFHLYIGKGTTRLEYDVSDLNPNEKHMIAATWSLSRREVNLYIDGEKVATAGIKYKISKKELPTT